MLFFSFVCVYLQQACDDAERSVSKLEERLSAQSLENQSLQSQNSDLRSMVKVSSHPWAVSHAAEPQPPTVGSVCVWGTSVPGCLKKLSGKESVQTTKSLSICSSISALVREMKCQVCLSLLSQDLEGQLEEASALSQKLETNECSLNKELQVSES